MLRVLYTTIFLFIFSLSLLYAGNDNFQIVSYTDKELVVLFELPSYKTQEIITENESFIRFVAEGSAVSLIAHEPDLPHYSFSIQVPEDAQISYDVSVLKSVISTMEHPIVPSRGNLYRNQDINTIPYIKGEVYSINAFYPSQKVSIADNFRIRSVSGQAIHIFPFSWNPVSGEMEIISKIKIKLSLQDNKSFQLAESNIPASFQNVYENVFLNYNISDYDPIDEEGNMLVICHDEWLDELQPLVDWKIQRGLPTEMVAVSQVGSTASAIKTYISDYYNSHDLAYVLLVGDDIHIPPVTSGVAGDSDNGYAYIIGNDHYPDIFVGRFSARTSADVITQVQRTLEYEKGELDDFEWIDKSMGIASQQGPGDDNEYDYQHIRNLQEQLVDYTYEEPYYEFYDGSQGGYDAANNPSGVMVVDGIDSGAGIIWYTGHGVSTGWSTSNFDSNDILLLENQQKLPIIISTACLVGNFAGGDSSCFAEVWMKSRKNGQPIGSVVNFMSTINQPWSPPMEAQDEMANIMTGASSTSKKYTVGGLAINGCYSMNEAYPANAGDVTDTWVLFGDPSLLIRTDIPSNLTVEHPEFVLEGTADITIECNQEDATVCLANGNEIIGIATISGGNATIPVASIPAGELLTLTITAYNAIPYQGEVLISTEAPLIVFDSYLINGVTELSYDSQQNIDITLQNIGINNASSVNASLTTSNSNVIAISGNLNVNYGSIGGGGETSTSTGNFNVTISNTVTNQEEIEFALEITADGETWNYNVVIPVNAPELDFGGSSVQDESQQPEFIGVLLDYVAQGTNYYSTVEVTQPGGNEDGNLDPGETLTIAVSINNFGDASINNVPVEITSTSAFVTIENNQAELNTINSGEVATAYFNIEIDENCPIGESIDFELDVLAGYYEISQTKNFTVGKADDTFETNDYHSLNYEQPDLPWEIIGNGYNSDFCASSPIIENSTTTELIVSANILTDDNVSFWLKTSTEEDCDEFSFLVDDVEMCIYSGELDWQQVSFPVTSGSHTFTWKYHKDFIFGSGDDRIYIDNISLPPCENEKTNIRFEEVDLPEWLTIEDQYNGMAVLTGVAPMELGIVNGEIAAKQNNQTSNHQFNIEIGTVSISQKNMKPFEVYPNPFTEDLKISTGTEIGFTLIINDLEGKLVYLHTFPDGNTSVNLGQLPKGTYIVKVISGGKTTKRTIIKN